MKEIWQEHSSRMTSLGMSIDWIFWCCTHVWLLPACNGRHYIMTLSHLAQTICYCHCLWSTVTWPHSDIMTVTVNTLWLHVVWHLFLLWIISSQKILSLRSSDLSLFRDHVLDTLHRILRDYFKCIFFLSYTYFSLCSYL